MAKITLKSGLFTGERGLTLLFLASVFAFACTKIGDTDSWTHLSFGRWIWEHRALPAEDPFITGGKPFPYNNWLFGVVYYLAYRLFDISGVIAFKALIAAAIFGILLKDALRPHRCLILALVVMAVLTLMVRGRFVERPDTFMMLSLAFSIFSLNAYLRDDKRYLCSLPLVHLIWANSHTSIALMFIPFLSLIVGGAVQRGLGNLLPPRGAAPLVAFAEAPSWPRIKTVSLVMALSFAGSLISPYVFTQYTHSLQALTSDWWKQEVIELQTPTWEDSKLLFAVTFVTILSFILNRSRLVLADLLMVVPFLTLAFTARRFIWFAALAGPILVRNLSSWCAESKTWNRWLKNRLALAAVSLWLVVAPLLLALQLKPFDSSQHHLFGIGIDHRFVPEGALRFMDDNGISGRVFNLFEWGGYITWRDFPKRTPFIDGRGFLASLLLERATRAQLSAPTLDELQSEHGFDSVLVSYPLVPEGTLPVTRDMAMAHSGWRLVYWDDLCLLYLKRGGPYDSVIQKYEYQAIKPANGVERFKLADYDYRTKLLGELERNRKETGSSKAYAFLGFMFNEMGLYREAIEMYSKVKDYPYVSHLVPAYAGIAYAYGQLGRVDTSISFYHKALALKESAPILQNLGMAYVLKGDKKTAIGYYQKALRLNNSLTSLYPQLFKLYQELGMKEDARKAWELYQSATVRKGGEEHFEKGTQAYLAKNFSVAIAEFQTSITVNPANPAPYSNLAYVYYDTGNLDSAFEYHKKATDIDAQFGASHYGLALIYKARGDKKMALKHWQDYLRLEPAGYYSRRAKEQMQELGE